MQRIRVVAVIAAVAVAAAVFFIFFVKVRHAVVVRNAQVAEEVLVGQAKEQQDQGNLLKAKELCQKLINDYPQSNLMGQTQKQIGDLNARILFSPAPTADSKVYVVQPQDTLTKIAKTNNTTADLIKRSNNLSSDLIKPGMKLKVSTAHYSILVDKSQNLLTLKAGDEVFKAYPVSTGLDNCTPIGKFTIITKLIDPIWYKAGAAVPPGSPQNILGSRWLGLSLQGYGIHGTTEPDSIGKQVTAGCIRMLNADVEELYAIVPPGTEVTIVD